MTYNTKEWLESVQYSKDIIMSNSQSINKEDYKLVWHPMSDQAIIIAQIKLDKKQVTYVE